MWVVRFVPFTGLVHETLAEIRERFVDETIFKLETEVTWDFYEYMGFKNTTTL